MIRFLFLLSVRLGPAVPKEVFISIAHLKPVYGRYWSAQPSGRETDISIGRFYQYGGLWVRLKCWFWGYQYGYQYSSSVLVVVGCGGELKLISVGDVKGISVWDEDQQNQRSAGTGALTSNLSTRITVWMWPMLRITPPVHKVGWFLAPLKRPP